MKTEEKAQEQVTLNQVSQYVIHDIFDHDGEVIYTHFGGDVDAKSVTIRVKHSPGNVVTYKVNLMAYLMSWAAMYAASSETLVIVER